MKVLAYGVGALIIVYLFVKRRVRSKLMKLYGLLSLVLMFLQVKFKHYTCNLGKCFRRSFIKTLPRIIKKQTLVVTLYLKGRNEEIFDEVDMKELNKYMVLANDPKVLDYLVSFNEKYDLYHFDFRHLLAKYNCSLDARVDDDIITSICKDIIEKTPVCLRYGESYMIQDIGNLLIRIPTFRLHQCPIRQS